VPATARAAWLLYALEAGDRYRDAATTAMAGVATIAVERPIAFGSALALMAELADPLVQVVTVLPDNVPDNGPDNVPDDIRDDERDPEPAGHRATELVAATRRHEASVAVVVTERQAAAFAQAGFELFEARPAGRHGRAYRCESFVCALPVEDAAALEELGAR